MKPSLQILSDHQLSFPGQTVKSKLTEFLEENKDLCTQISKFFDSIRLVGLLGFHTTLTVVVASMKSVSWRWIMILGFKRGRELVAVNI